MLPNWDGISELILKVILHHLLDKQIEAKLWFYFPVLCCFCDFTQLLYSSGQMPIRTVFPVFYTLLGFTALLGGLHRNVKSGFYCSFIISILLYVAKIHRL
jgi:hypothetical protein